MLVSLTYDSRHKALMNYGDSNEHGKQRGICSAHARDYLREALEIADEEGIENASARKIATALGKTPMALYRHCASISDIQQGACALAFSEVDTTPIPGERWDDTVRRTTASIRAMKVRHARACLFKIKGTALSPA